VESTVRDAVGFDYVAVPADCVASSSSQAGHARSIESMTAHLRYAEGVTTSERLIAVWQRLAD
jgi:nicotinamidase-related amidase